MAFPFWFVILQFNRNLYLWLIKRNIGRHWYVLHTYSGQEDRVAENLKQRTKSFKMEDKVFDILVPREKNIKIKERIKLKYKREC